MKNIQRNPYRLRKAPRRTMPKNKIDSGVLDQLKAERFGLLEEANCMSEQMIAIAQGLVED
jgi:hypothetical protein